MTLLVLIYGLIIGSFLNVCIYRIPRDESIAFPGSHCPSCNSKLRWYDNIPLFSYLSLGGKCRYCSISISNQYPIVEALNGILYLIMHYKFGFSIDFIFYSLLSSILIIVTFIDLQEMIIPDVLILSILVLSILYKAINYFIGLSPQFLSSILGMFLAGGLFLAIVLISNGGMGGGDVTLITALGFVIGIKHIILTIFLSFLIGAIISIFLLISKIKGRRDPIPFGPFIIIGFFISIYSGESLINWYISLLS